MFINVFYINHSSLPFIGSSIRHDSRENVNKLHFMNNFPGYINLTLYNAFYDIMYFYISTYNLIKASNKSDTARHTNRTISPVSLKMAVLTSSSKMKVRLRYSSLFVKHFKTFIKRLYTKLMLLKCL